MIDTLDFIRCAHVKKLVADVIKRMFADQKRPILIAVGGPGGSGKTTFAHALKKLLEDADVLSLDNYKVPRHQRISQDTWGPHPAANNLSLIEQHLAALKTGCTIDVPWYDIESGCSNVTNVFTPKHFNIIEGEISTYEQFATFIDFSIFIESDLKTQLSTRLTRDIAERGHSYEKAVTNFLKSNIHEYKTYGAHSKAGAQVTLYSHDDYSLQIESVQEWLIPAFQNCYSEIEANAVEGLIVPLTTPFEQNGEICRGALVDHIQWLYGKGVTRLLISGTTAEFFSLTTAERLTLLDCVRENFPGMVIFQTGCSSLKDTLSLMNRAVRHGADVIMALPPYYYANLPEQGIIDYFKEVSELCTVPFFLYNFPKHTGNPLTAGILSAVPHDGVKDSGGDYDLLPATPRFLAGSSTKIVQAYQKGAKGFVSALANVYPDCYVSLERKLADSDLESAKELQLSMVEKKEKFPDIPEIILLKKMLKKLIPGYPEYVRLPLDNREIEVEV